MHQIWSIPEVVDSIFLHLFRPDLSSLLRVNTCFFDRAATLLWEEVTTADLSNVVPSQELNRRFALHPIPSTLERLSLYGRYIRWLCIRADLTAPLRDALQRVLREMNASLLFPGLRIMSVEIPEGDPSEDYAETIDLQAELFLSCLYPGVKKAILALSTGALEYTNYLSSLVEGMHGRVPGLEALQIQRQFGRGMQRVGYTRATTLFQQSMLAIPDRPYLPALRSFASDAWVIHPTLIRRLSRLPGLQELFIHPYLGNPMVGWNEEMEEVMLRVGRDYRALLDTLPPVDEFPALRTLDLSGHAEALQYILALAPTTISLCLRLEAGLVTNSLPSIAKMQDLDELLLICEDKDDSAPQPTPSNTQLLSNLRHCTKLRSLHIRAWSIPFTQQEIETACKQWPSLRSVSLRHPTVTRPIPWSSLETLLTGCPELRRVSIPFTIARPDKDDHSISAPPITTNRVVFAFLSDLRLEKGTDEKWVAGQFYAACPNLVLDFEAWLPVLAKVRLELERLQGRSAQVTG